MNIWPVQDAKARFSELLELSMREGPQLVTKRGTAAAVLVAVAEWEALNARAQRTLVEVLLDPAGPKFDDGWPLVERNAGKWRTADFNVFT